MRDTAVLPIDEAVQQTSGKAPKIQMNEEYHKAIKLQHATHIIADFGNTTYLSRNASVPRRARLPSIHCHHRHWKIGGVITTEILQSMPSTNCFAYRLPPQGKLP